MGLKQRISLVGAMLLAGCARVPGSMLDPEGPVALAQLRHLESIVLWTAVVVVPVLVLTPLVAWRYRSGNERASYRPKWEFWWPLEFLIWGVPVVVVSVLGWHLWIQTHRLDPYRPLAGAGPAEQVEVVGLDWKWLFIYPKEGIATVNELVFPAGRPLSLRITSDTAMQSFMIPALGGQIYAMGGMQTRLHLMANAPGSFVGENMQYNGVGFDKQRFAAEAVPDAAFDAWVAHVKAAGGTLNARRYQTLAKRSVAKAPMLFASVTPGLFQAVMAKYHGPKPARAGELAGESGPTGRGSVGLGSAGRGSAGLGSAGRGSVGRMAMAPAGRHGVAGLEAR